MTPTEKRFLDLLVMPNGQITGQISLPEAHFLASLVQKLTGGGPIIEIGTLFGWSTCIMACAKNPTRKLITVDNYSWSPLPISHEMHYAITSGILGGQLGIEQVRADKAAFYAAYDGPSPSLVFADAVHTYEETRQDIIWAIEHGSSVVCGHDYMPQAPGVVRAVDEFGGPKQLVGTLWVL